MDVDPSRATSQDARDDEDEEDYENEGGNRLLGFMFGNVDDSGDLDVDYLDEDAKEHLAALADKLGPSLTDIDLIKSSSALADASEQDYDEKAEDAIDYEDIDEQYDGPEIQSSTEEDHLLPKKDYFSSDALLASIDHKGSVFDEENYDEDEEIKENQAMDDNIEVKSSSADEKIETTAVQAISTDESLFSARSPETDEVAFDLEDFQEEENVEQEPEEFRGRTSLPVLCVEDGMVILKFSEIFGIHEPLRKAEKKDLHRHSMRKKLVKTVDVVDVEEDEETFLRSSFHDQSCIKHPSSTVSEVEMDVQHGTTLVDEKINHSCLCSQPMKNDVTIDISACQSSPLSPKFYPLYQQDWENTIVWGNSPTASHGYPESCVLSEADTEANTDTELKYGHVHKNIELESENLIDPFLVEPLGSRNFSEPTYQSLHENFHPQLLRLESVPLKNDSCSVDSDTKYPTEDIHRSMLRRFNKLSLQNKDLLDGSWLDKVVWDPDEAISEPKLILDLQDEQMLFEIFDHKDSESIHSHAGAMVMLRSSNSYPGDSSDPYNLTMASVGRFNISNDKYYSNRKTSQQAKSHTKKRSFHGIKVMHSVPALRLQTMKPKLSNKDIANFHRPKALWFPHDNEVIAKSQGSLCTSGPIKIIISSLGGKGFKLHVNAEETSSAVKTKASKKLEFRPSEEVKVFYSGKELEDGRSLAEQNVCPNSVLHLVRTKVHVWPKAQKLPGESKPLRPPGAFKKKSDLSVKDGHVFLMEYCEERPLLLGNVGMGARLCTYYQKVAASDPTASSLRNGNDGLGTVLPLEPSDKSPFLGDIGPGYSQSCLETNMYRAPIFSHKSSFTDYLLVRSAKGMLSLRRIDRLYSVGQQEPHMEVLSPGSKSVQTYLVNRMLVYVYRTFRANEKPDALPLIRADDLASQFPALTDAIIRKRLKHCADLRKAKNGMLVWVKRSDFRIPLEDELRRMLVPENVCCYESMLAGLYRLKRLGISRLTHPVGLSSAMNQLPDEAIALAAASHIERELQITPWNLTSNFVACTSQDRENIERLEITGVGDPSGRGLGFSYVRVTPKAPLSNAMPKKKAASAKVGSTVTGTDADLRRLSMDAAREVLLKFGVPEDQIVKLTRWHRIALVRKLSSEQAASGVKVDEMPISSKFARGQRMSFCQLQQQTREKCQEIWDRQVQSLSAADGDEIDSDSEANSDLDSFAGDLENLLDAEAFDEKDGNIDSKGDKGEVVRGLKMRRVPSQAQTEEQMEDDKAEAALLRHLLEDDDAEIKKKKKKPTWNEIGRKSLSGSNNVDSLKKTAPVIRYNVKTPHPDGPFTLKESRILETNEVDDFLIEKKFSGQVNPKYVNEKNDALLLGIINKKTSSAKDGFKVFKEKKQVDSRRETFVCGACGQHGHMRTNKNCPKYHEDVEISELETGSGKSYHPDVGSQQLKLSSKKLTPKLLVKGTELDVPESAERAGSKSSSKVIPLKFKCGSSDKFPERNLRNTQPFDKQTIISAETESKPIKISKLIISNKSKSEDVHCELPKPSLVIRPPVDVEKDQPLKKIIIKQPKALSEVGQFNEPHDFGMGYEFKKTKKITELSSFEKQKKQESHWFHEENIRGKAMYERGLRDEEERRRSKQRVVEESTWRMTEESMLNQPRITASTSWYAESTWKEDKKSKKKKKKKQKPDFRDEYLLDHKPYRNDRRIPERDRASKRRPVVDSGQLEYAPPIKRRRGAEVAFSNILESIVDSLKENRDVSLLFLKPVTKKEAPDYFDYVQQPMDLSTIRDKVRNMEYKNVDAFRHDMWQITYNAHAYNDGRNPGIPPLADQLLELCDYLISEKMDILMEAEAEIGTDM